MLLLEIGALHVAPPVAEVSLILKYETLTVPDDLLRIAREPGVELRKNFGVVPVVVNDEKVEVLPELKITVPEDMVNPAVELTVELLKSTVLLAPSQTTAKPRVLLITDTVCVAEAELNLVVQAALVPRVVKTETDKLP